MARQRPIAHAEIVQRFGARLRELRLSRGLTQAELARQAQVATSYIGRLEGGGAAPGIDLVDRLARTLGASVHDLLPLEVPPDTLSVLQGNARRLFETLLQGADRETLLMLNPLLARLIETLPRG